MRVIVQNIATDYTRTGSGRVLLVLHGWGDSSASWQTFAAKLAKNYDVVVPDLPGFGLTEAPPEAWNLTDYATFVRDFLQKIGVKPYAVMGHSNGGAIAIRGVGRGLFQAEKLVLLASAGVRSSNSATAYRVIAKVGKAITAPLPKRVTSKLRRKLYETAGSDLLVAEHMQETFKKIVRDDVRADAAYISTPTLLLYGAADEQTPVKLGEQLNHDIDGSSLRILNGAGHFIHLDAPEEVVSATEEFLGE
ncbi:alpha/beta hydrolase [Candidatus Saccharibacteria bacterium]|nr:MAG: alpha/beta hydrolase [Candidatus Saccharibacteria bacterium]